jgi:hypothetical protein
MAEIYALDACSAATNSLDTQMREPPLRDSFVASGNEIRDRLHPFQSSRQANAAIAVLPTSDRGLDPLLLLMEHDMLRCLIESDLSGDMCDPLSVNLLPQNVNRLPSCPRSTNVWS